jgi:hypothetical protein
MPTSWKKSTLTHSPRFLSSFATERRAGNDGLNGAGNLIFLVFGVRESLVSADESELHPSEEDTIMLEEDILLLLLDSDSPLSASFDGIEGNMDDDW